jgi:hypothetical protein
VTDTRQSWDELPLKYGEDGEQYNNHYARYSHIGCPGCSYEDNCSAPWDCASKGRCRMIYERIAKATGAA